MENTQKMSSKIPKELHTKLKDEAKTRGLSLNALVIFILENHYKDK